MRLDSLFAIKGAHIKAMHMICGDIVVYTFSFILLSRVYSFDSPSTSIISSVMIPPFQANAIADSTKAEVTKLIWLLRHC